MELSPMKLERANADQPRVVGTGARSNDARGQAPRVNRMRLPNLCGLFARLFEAQVVSHRLRLPSLLDGDRGQFVQSVVKPVLSHFQRGEAAVPLPCFTWPGGRSDVLDDKDPDREELEEKPRQPQFPLPASFGRRRQLLLT